MDDNQQDQNQNTDEVSIERLEKDLQDAMNRWKRTAADFENYKKQKEKENKEILEFAKEVTVVKLLPTIDTLEQALRHLPQHSTSSVAKATSSPQGEEAPRSDQGFVPSSPSSDDGLQRRRDGDEVSNDFAKQYANWQTGVNGIVKQLDKVLEELGVKKIQAIGKKFDPHLHEAVKEVEMEGEDGIVVDELQSGFELNGKVIRPSQVIISKKKTATE